MSLTSTALIKFHGDFRKKRKEKKKKKYCNMIPYTPVAHKMTQLSTTTTKKNTAKTANALHCLKSHVFHLSVQLQQSLTTKFQHQTLENSKETDNMKINRVF